MPHTKAAHVSLMESSQSSGKTDVRTQISPATTIKAATAITTNGSQKSDDVIKSNTFPWAAAWEILGLVENTAAPNRADAKKLRAGKTGFVFIAQFDWFARDNHENHRHARAKHWGSD
ncbi:MAG: hypothetical protein K9J42_07935 [Sulfuritalea sp.]|nr:hypothetical protein [Sulfuritalea sp.]